MSASGTDEYFEVRIKIIYDNDKKIFDVILFARLSCSM